MGQLTNQFVSQSYQGLLNLANANTGFTTNLQTITDGLGGSSPLQISQTQVNISGTFTVNGAPISVDTGSLVTTSSFNAYTSSVNIKLAGLDVETGSLQNQINGLATTSSLSTLSGSIAVTDLSQNNRLTALETFTGSIDTGYVSEVEFGNYTSSMNNFTSSIDGRVDALEIETGSLQNQINGLATTSSLNSYTLTSSFNAYTSSNDSKVNSLISQTGSYVTETESGSFVTNVAGGPISFENLITVTKGNGSSSNITINNVNNAVSSSYATNALSASYAPDISNRNGLITTGSIGGNQSITGSLDVQGTISATSASFTYVTTTYETASVIYSSGSNQFGDASNDTQTLWGTVVLPTLNQYSGSTSNNFVTWNNVSQGLEYTDTIPSSSYAVTSSIAFDLVVNGKCDNPGGLTKGTIVRITGANGDNPLFNSASWTDDFNSANTLGMLSEDVAYNGFANIVVQGKVIGINTSGMTAGDMLYLSSSGQYTTSSVPAPYHEVRLGQVLRPQLNNGSAYISIDNGYELTELHDVDITSPVVGDLLVYRSGSYGQWVNEDGAQLGFAITGSNNFVGQQNINGDVNITGSLNVSGTTSLNILQPNEVKQNLLLLGNRNSVTSSVVLNNYLNSITTSLDNDDVNFAMVPGGILLSPLGIANQTGSVFISGSNNFIMSLGSQTPPTQGRRGILGTANVVVSTIPSINTSSLTLPAINNSVLLGQPFFTLSSGSNFGNGTHQFNNNLVLNAVTLNHPSASQATNAQTVWSNNINVGGIVSNMSGSLLSAGSSMTSNILAGAVTLNHISSSINFGTNIVAAGGSNFINNRFFNTGSNNFVPVSANIIGGQGITFNIAGSPATNTTRTIVGNLIGGQNVVISTEETGTDLAGFRNSLVWGNQLIVSGSNSATDTNQSSVFLGRFNGVDNGLADSRRTILAVGTGTSNANRRVGFYITSGSLVGVSGSFDVKGVTNAMVVTGSATIEHTIAGQPALTLKAQSIGQPALLVSGTFSVTGSGDHSIVGNSLSVLGSTNITGSLGVTGSAIITGSVRGNVLPLSVTSNTASLNLDLGNLFELALTGSSDIRIEPSNIKPGQTINIKLNTTGSGTVSFPTSVKQPSGSAYVPTTAVGTDILTMVSFDNTNLFVANVKNLI